MFAHALPPKHTQSSCLLKGTYALRQGHDRRVSIEGTESNQHPTDTQSKKYIYKNIIRSIKFYFTPPPLSVFIVAQKLLPSCTATYSLPPVYQ